MTATRQVLTAVQVKAAMQQAALGRTFGGSKVWLCDVALYLNSPLHKIADQLIGMQQRGEIGLSRCDLVQLAPAGFVEASTVRHMGAEWQLMRL